MANPLTMKDAEMARDAITKEQTQHIASLYKEWAKDINEQAKFYSTKKTASSAFSERYMKELKKQMTQTSKLVANDIYATTKGSLLQVSDAVVRSNVDWMKSLGFGGGGMALSYIPNDTVTRLVTGQIYEGGWNLSKAIWGDQQKTLQDIYTIIAKGTAEQLSVYEIAKELEKYVDPTKALAWNYKASDGAWIYKKQVDYNAQRLARTLVQHAYQQSAVSAAKVNPFVKGFIWRASGARVCPLCDEMDGSYFEKSAVPFDHPNGMCSLEPVTDPDIEDKLAAWVKDEGSFPEIDAFAKLVGGANDAIKRAEFLAKYGSLTGKGSQYGTWWTWLDKLPAQAQVDAKMIKEASGKGWGPWYKENIYSGTKHVAGTKKEVDAASKVASAAKEASTAKTAKNVASNVASKDVKSSVAEKVAKPKANTKNNFVSTLGEGSSYGMSATYSEIEKLYGKEFLEEFKAALHSFKNEGVFTSHLEAWKSLKAGNTNGAIDQFLAKHEKKIADKSAEIKAAKEAEKKLAEQKAKEAAKLKEEKLKEAKKKAEKALAGAKKESDISKWWSHVKQMDEDTLSAIAKAEDLSKLTEAERNAIVKYTGSWYNTANNMFREMASKGIGYDELAKLHGDDAAMQLKNLESAFTKLKTSGDMYVRRGSSAGDIVNLVMSMSDEKQVNIMGVSGLSRSDLKQAIRKMSVDELNEKFAGELVRYDNVISTSVASNKGFSGPLETVFYLPKGTNASAVMSISRFGTGEGELIIGNGHYAVIRGFEYLERAHKDAHVRMFVEIVPK